MRNFPNDPGYDYDLIVQVKLIFLWICLRIKWDLWNISYTYLSLLKDYTFSKNLQLRDCSQAVFVNWYATQLVTIVHKSNNWEDYHLNDDFILFTETATAIRFNNWFLEMECTREISILNLLHTKQFIKKAGVISERKHNKCLVFCTYEPESGLWFYWVSNIKYKNYPPNLTH